MNAPAPESAGRRKSVPLPNGGSMMVAEMGHAALAHGSQGHHPMSSQQTG
jgi:hypothetical protein